MDLSYQRGLGLFGGLVVLAIAVVAGYYGYKAVIGGEEAPSCKSSFNTCMQKCRRTATEAPAAQACQEACQRDADSCNRQGR
ncbi:MAG TPA: hypothetical protein VN929_02635 [Burkholderiales bacterium]|nr:hypothetical protein [Burkholderiales bacterium]